MINTLNVVAGRSTEMAALWLDTSGRKSPHCQIQNLLLTWRFEKLSSCLWCCIWGCNHQALHNYLLYFKTVPCALWVSFTYHLPPPSQPSHERLSSLFFFSFLFQKKNVGSIFIDTFLTWYMLLASSSLAFLFGSFTSCCAFSHCRAGWDRRLSFSLFIYLAEWSVQSFRKRQNKCTILMYFVIWVAALEFLIFTNHIHFPHFIQLSPTPPHPDSPHRHAQLIWLSGVIIMLAFLRFLLMDFTT